MAPELATRVERDRASRVQTRAEGRRHLFLHGPIALTLLSFSAPTMMQVGVQALINVVEGYFVGRIGTDALAGISLVFPIMILVQALAGGAIGGGASSSVARALGAGRRTEADSLLLHAVLIALALGLVSSALLLGFGPILYRTLGGQHAALASALTYSNIVFCAAALIWLANIMSAVLRGTGNMIVPAVATFVSAIILIALSPCLIFGLGPFPRLEIAGAGIAVAVYYVSLSIVVGSWLLSGRGVIRLRFSGLSIKWEHFAKILRVGLVSALLTIQNNLSVLVVTAVVGSFGITALAGYGMAARLEFLISPIMWSLGASIIAMVGTCMGAKQIGRARRVAWTATIIGMAFTGAVGVAAALFPYLWLDLFSSDAGVLAFGTQYFQIVGPFYTFVGMGLAVYFASQASGRMFWAYVGNLLRLVIVAGGGWIAVVVLGGGLHALYFVIAGSMMTYGLISACGLALSEWDTTRADPG